MIAGNLIFICLLEIDIHEIQEIYWYVYCIGMYNVVRPVFVQRLFIEGVFVQSIPSNLIRLGLVSLD